MHLTKTIHHLATTTMHCIITEHLAIKDAEPYRNHHLATRVHHRIIGIYIYLREINP